MARTIDRSDLFNDRRTGNIYRTAAKIIADKGFAATSMNEIAEAAGMTKPGVYYHVKGKQDLLFSIMSFALDNLEAEVVELAREVSSPEERLRIIIRQHALLLTREPGAAEAVAILMDETRELDRERREQITRRKRAYFEFLRCTLDELRDAGRLRAVDATVAAFSLLGMVMWIARWYRPDGRLAGNDVVRDVTEIAVAGVLDRGAFQKPIGLARSL